MGLFVQLKDYEFPSNKGLFGDYGGKFIPETLYYALTELERTFKSAIVSKEFKESLNHYFQNYVGRPSPIYYAAGLSSEYGCKVYLKREDLNHTGSHKINNALGQVLLAKKMGKQRIIAETGAGQHGVATATASALLGIQCEIYMGAEDVRRQKLNVFRMELLGAKVHVVEDGSKTLKDAMNGALRDWVATVENTHYVIGSVAGPHPFPWMVREFQSVIGLETKIQLLEKEGRLPDYLIACVGGGSNAMGLFYPFYEDKTVNMIGVEAGGYELKKGGHSATLTKGAPGVLHGSKSYLLYNPDNGLIDDVHSIAAGLDYPGVGPEHSFFKTTGRAVYSSVSDKEALKAFKRLSLLEGIMPALESAHAIAQLEKMKEHFKQEDIVVINLSGRGDKDVNEVDRILKSQEGE